MIGTSVKKALNYSSTKLFSMKLWLFLNWSVIIPSVLSHLAIKPDFTVMMVQKSVKNADVNKNT